MLHALTFQYGKPITIDHTKVPSTLTNFPVLVSIANDNDLKNHVTSPNGYDLVFTDAIGNPLDVAQAKSQFWVGSTTAHSHQEGSKIFIFSSAEVWRDNLEADKS
jgi:hypothetical protein